MTTPPGPFRESSLWSTPIRDLGLTIEGTRLEPSLQEFKQELRRVGLTRLEPRFYLSTEWGVGFQTVDGFRTRTAWCPAPGSVAMDSCTARWRGC